MRGKKSYANLLPTCGVPPQIHASFAHASFNIDRSWVGLVSCQPAPLNFVIPPFATHELLGHKFLQDITRHAIKDVEESLIAETRNTGLQRLYVCNIVTGRKSEVLLERNSRHGGNKGGGERVMKRST
jgi:hypothetical protein